MYKIADTRKAYISLNWRSLGCCWISVIRHL